MLTKYLAAAMRHAHYEILKDDGTFYGEIPECRGVYANARTLEECRDELASVLEDWVLFSVHKNLPLPAIEGHRLRAAGDLHARGTHGELMMYDDPIVNEIRQIRKQHADKFGGDLHAICEDLRRLERESGRQYVSFPPRPAVERSSPAATKPPSGEGRVARVGL